MQLSDLRNFALSFLLGTGLASADKITLASGDVLEGEVIKETADEYVIRVKVSGGIKDNRTFKKIDVKSIEKEAPYLKPFQEIEKLPPLGDLHSPDFYTGIIEAQLKPFLAQFPKSKVAPQVKELLSTYESELARVQAGDRKVDGKWISADDWNADAIENDALIEFNKMKRLADRKRYRAAMIQYDAIEKQFAGSKAAEKAREVASDILPSYQRIVSRLSLRAKKRLDEHKKNIKSLPPRDSRRVKQAFEENMATHMKAVEKSREERIKWIPTNEFDEKNLQRLRSHIESTLRKFERPPRRGRNTSELYRQAWAAASNGDAKLVKRILSQLKSAKADPKYADLINEQLAANPPKAPEKPAEKKMAPKPEPKMEKEKPKKEKKKRTRRESSEDEDEDIEEEKSSLFPIIGGVILLSLIGILGALFVSKKKKEGGE